MGVAENYDDDVERKRHTSRPVTAGITGVCNFTGDERPAAYSWGDTYKGSIGEKDSPEGYTTHPGCGGSRIIKVDGQTNSRVVIPSQECVGRSRKRHMSKKYTDRQTEKITCTNKRIRVLRPKSRILKVHFPFPFSVSVSVSVSSSVSDSASVV